MYPPLCNFGQGRPPDDKILRDCSITNTTWSQTKHEPSDSNIDPRTSLEYFLRKVVRQGPLSGRI